MHFPKVLIVTMMKNSERWLPLYFKNLQSLSYPKKRMRLIVEMGPSQDRTLEMLKEFKDRGIMDLEVYGDPVDDWLSRGGIYAAGAIWRDFQKAVSRNDHYVFFFDVDLVQIPKDLIQRLMEIGADVAAPYVWSEGHRHYFDNYIYRIENKRFHPLNPPGMGLDYPIYVDSVGTCFLATKDAWTKPEITNPEPYFSWSRNARAMGFSIVACPFIEIFHVDLEKLGVLHYPPPREWSNHGNGWIDSSYPVRRFKKNE